MVMLVINYLQRKSEPSRPGCEGEELAGPAALDSRSCILLDPHLCGCRARFMARKPHSEKIWAIMVLQVSCRLRVVQESSCHLWVELFAEVQELGGERSWY